jgi:superfamily II DNA/RNA helicase
MCCRRNVDGQGYEAPQVATVGLRHGPADVRADILVATPGRLNDLLTNGGLKPRLAHLKTLVLDEADRLLDAGFRKELLQILGALPDRKVVSRQTLLFSATIPKEVHTVCLIANQLRVDRFPRSQPRSQIHQHPQTRRHQRARKCQVRESRRTRRRYHGSRTRCSVEGTR